MKDELKEYFSRFVANASERDIPKIAQNLAAMCRGPIQKAWGDVQALWAMIKDPDAAWKSKTIAIGALLYLVSPIDLIPDAIPVLGLTDDASVVAAAVASLSFELKKYRGEKLPAVPVPANQPESDAAIQERRKAFAKEKTDRLTESFNSWKRKEISWEEFTAIRADIFRELGVPSYTTPAAVAPSQPKQIEDNSVEFRLKRLSGLLENKIISQAEHDAKRQQILSEL